MAQLKITIYTTHTCPFCKMEKAFLASKQAPYQEILVDDDERERDRMVELTDQRGVPVTILTYEDGARTYFIGFQEDLLEKALSGARVGDPVTG